MRRSSFVIWSIFSAAGCTVNMDEAGLPGARVTVVQRSGKSPASEVYRYTYDLTLTNDGTDGTWYLVFPSPPDVRDDQTAIDLALAAGPDFSWRPLVGEQRRWFGDDPPALRVDLLSHDLIIRAYYVPPGVRLVVPDAAVEGDRESATLAVWSVARIPFPDGSELAQLLRADPPDVEWPPSLHLEPVRHWILRLRPPPGM